LNQNGSIQLFYDAVVKLSTTSSGISVTGTVAATAFAGDGSNLTGIAGTPAGAVIYHADGSAPTGFIKANGASISTSTYSDLFAVIGYTFGGSGGSFNVPDLRGEFIRCWDGSRGVDSGRALGSSQGDLFKSHSHTFGVWQATTNTAHNGAGTGSTHYQSTQSVSSVGGTETRPRNIALLACIKY
jgi:microcystin-dependent protein